VERPLAQIGGAASLRANRDRERAALPPGCLAPLPERIGITEQNVSLLKSGKVKGVRFDTLERICAVLDCQPGDILEYRSEAEAERSTIALRV